jgi:hypothetical protein
LARSYTVACINCLVEVMHRATESAARISAAKALLERGWGLPKVEVSVEQAVYVIRDEPLSVEAWQRQYCSPQDDAPRREPLPELRGRKPN